MSVSPSTSEQVTPRLSRRLIASTLCVAIRLLSFTFLRVNHFYGACVGRVLSVVASDMKHVAETNLRIAFPNQTEGQRRTLLRDYLAEMGKTMTELGPLWSWNRRRISNLITEIRGKEHVTEALSHGKGVIVLVPHFGAWELSGLHLSLEYQVVSLYRPPRLSGLAAFVKNARERFGAVLVPTNVSGVRALRKSLKLNQMTGILPDQDPGDEGSVRAPFFGYSARTMVLVSRLAAKSQSKVVYLAAERLPRGAGYRLHYLPAHPDIASTDELVAASALNQGVEDVIKIAPPQYLWGYKRFRGRIAGKIDPYKQAKQAASKRRAA
ncbi:lysophospholipid acyltransferase family protein [Planctomycetes bacterium K23_9]|uniref:Lipid A biosynthesis lauroyl acyltransferase n=1 Tax=Stieleria marina TaxID=1930275 RepID=A0A517NSM4_9BACT|nr:Lipid A biosynthesis lauroyl acyltransferase [Planctomycetes bacterium K23_9]